MKIVLVEDRPWKLKRSIQEIRDRGIDLDDLIYVCWNENFVDDQTKKSLENLRSDIEGLKISITDNEHFETVAQEFYDQPQYLILSDFNLTGDDREYFEKRANVAFARKIMDKETKKPSSRMWFYTTAGEATNEQINNAFPGRNISVLKMEEEQVILDVDEIERAVQMQNE